MANVFWLLIEGLTIIGVLNMCGRFTFVEFNGIEERFQIPHHDLKPNYNVAPTQDVPIILNDGA